ncbi:hypothetical protein [Sandarakinorhabdus sp.]|uniref:hypothetical protein n=1 Tax=Sandarakinorhabdus sp. TaxID=1916663 RepID=UPI00286E5522|nr:hypothetical protein [Sandarakinorhabdus sp.]
MSRGSYFGGSTVIHPGSGWFGNGGPCGPSTTKKKKPQKTGNAKNLVTKAAVKAQSANKKTLRSLSPKPEDPNLVAKRLSRHMKGVEVRIRKSTGEEIVRNVKPKPTLAGRARLSLKSKLLD